MRGLEVGGYWREMWVFGRVWRMDCERKNIQGFQICLKVVWKKVQLLAQPTIESIQVLFSFTPNPNQKTTHSLTQNKPFSLPSLYIPSTPPHPSLFLPAYQNKRIITVLVQLFFTSPYRLQSITMASSGSTQSQASYFPIILEKPPLEFLIETIKTASEETEASSAMSQLAETMRHAEGETFEQCLLGVNHLFHKGYTGVFMTYVDLMRKMMNHFTKLGKQLEDDTHDQNIEFRMLYVLSLIAELIRENPKFYFPFTRKFLVTVFRIDYELLQKSSRKRDILAILSVIYENFSRQGRLVNKYNMISTLKTSLLENYSLIEELFTLKVFNRAICNLATKGLVFTTQEFTKHRVLATLAQFIEKSQIDLFMVKLKMAMMWLGKDRVEEEEKKVEMTQEI